MSWLARRCMKVRPSVTWAPGMFFAIGHSGHSCNHSTRALGRDQIKNPTPAFYTSVGLQRAGLPFLLGPLYRGMHSRIRSEFLDPCSVHTATYNRPPVASAVLQKSRCDSGVSLPSQSLYFPKLQLISTLAQPVARCPCQTLRLRKPSLGSSSRGT
ncbi:uncharacterized protein EI90DRAFT_3066730 [Cantharellus anzutake]|uniref:uncharacterized protein n=1 Tax=Cantharellus anzutake TaxID=1750568 RepID=UPI0019076483|nr:uncharacterized protein EI90DRAFT_3066730 [Cantharellus anzutake]KAF8327716.1 hypothetical protein EI90DRAFT_3066730 [Cantharellus anzutake]